MNPRFALGEQGPIEDWAKSKIKVIHWMNKRYYEREGGLMLGLVKIGMFILATGAFAAPFPGTSLLRPESGLFWRSQGFELGTRGTDWKMDDRVESSAPKDPMGLSYRLGSSSTARIGRAHV